MKFSRLLVLAIGLAWSLTANAGVTEQQIRKFLPGKWQVSYSQEGGSIQGISIYRSNGKVTYEGSFQVGSLILTFQAKGKWTVAGNKVTVVITESSDPDLTPVGAVEIDTVLVIDKNYYTYIDDKGEKKTEARVPTS